MLKRTKIVATISDRKCDKELISELRKVGMNVVRLNTAHQTHEDTLKVINNVRAVSEKIALLLDTKGPEIRTTESTENIPVSFGDKIVIKGDPEGITSKACVYVNYKGFVKDVPVESRILIDDGEIELVVKEKDNKSLVCEATNNGVISGKKSVNIPSVHVTLPTLSKKDIGYIHFAVDNNIYAYFRYTEEETVMVLLNNSKQSKQADLTKYIEILKAYKTAKNVLTDEMVKTKDKLTLESKSINIFELIK